MKILYLANIRLPSEKAEGLQVMKMCEAFAKAKARGLVRTSRGQTQTEDLINNFVELVVPRRVNPRFKREDPYEFYHVKKNFKITKMIPDFSIWILILEILVQKSLIINHRSKI